MAEEKQAESDLKAHENSMTCSKINIVIFVLMDLCGTLFAFSFLLTGAPHDEETLVLFALMVTTGSFLVAVVPGRVPALYGTLVHRIMLSFLMLRTVAFAVALALVIRFERTPMLMAWLVFHTAYLMFALTFYVLSKRRKADRNTVTGIPLIFVEDTGQVSNGATPV